MSRHAVEITADGIRQSVIVDGVDLTDQLASAELTLQPGYRPVLRVAVRLVDVTSYSSPETEMILATGHDVLVAMGWTPPSGEPHPLQRQLHEAEQARDGAYRERAQLTAWLATLHPAVLAPATDVDEPGWQVLYLYADGHQMSWHIHPRDAELFAHVEQVSAYDPRAQWNGHTTEEKYEAIRSSMGERSAGC